MVEEAFFGVAGFTGLFLFVQIHSPTRHSGWSARLNLLRPPVNSFFPYQSENVRIEIYCDIRRARKGLLTNWLTTSRGRAVAGGTSTLNLFSCRRHKITVEVVPSLDPLFERNQSRNSLFSLRK